MEYILLNLFATTSHSVTKTTPSSMDSLVIFNKTDNSAKWQIKKV